MFILGRKTVLQARVGVPSSPWPFISVTLLPLEARPPRHSPKKDTTKRSQHQHRSQEGISDSFLQGLLEKSASGQRRLFKNG